MHGYKPLCECRELNLVPLQEQMFLTAEPILKPLGSSIVAIIKFY